MLAGPSALAAQSWAALSSGLNGRAYATVIDSQGNVYVGGEFTTAGGITVNQVAKWNGTTWQSIGGGVTGVSGNTFVLALALDSHDNLYVGGRFTAAGGIPASNVAKWNGSTWSAVGSGTTTGVVRALAIDGAGTLYAGGDFTQIGGVPAGYVASYDGMYWSNMSFGLTGTSPSVSALGVSGSDVYVGGSFTGPVFGGAGSPNIARWDGSGWSGLGSGTNDVVNALTVDASGNVYAGGAFTTADGASVNRVTKWNGTSWSSLGGGLNDNVMDLTIDAQGSLLAAGYFTSLLSRWDGATWSALGGGASSGTWADAISARGGLVVAGGQFGTVGGVNVNYVAQYGSTPSVTSISPSTGPASGGTTLTISGTDFVAGATEVTVGGAFCTSPAVTSTQITCTTPGGTGSASVVVRTFSGQAVAATSFTYSPIPVVSAVSPSVGSVAGGTLLTITGTEFTSVTSVTLGGAHCSTFTVTSPTQITCVTPPHASGPVNLVVTTPGGSSVASTGSEFTYRGAPTLTSVVPSQGALAGGTQITLTGTEFADGMTVSLGGLSCTSVAVSSNTATCTVPAHAPGSVDVAVNNGISTGSLTSGFTYVAGLPSITSVSPATGPVEGGTVITLTGSEFASGMSVSVGGSTCTTVIVTSGTSASCTTPGHAGGTVDVAVTNASGSAILPTSFTFIAPQEDTPDRQPQPLRYGIEAFDGMCPERWSGPSWERWPNAGLGGWTCTLVIEWSASRNTYAEDPKAALRAARTWEVEVRRHPR